MLDNVRWQVAIVVSLLRAPIEFKRPILTLSVRLHRKCRPSPRRLSMPQYDRSEYCRTQPSLGDLHERMVGLQLAVQGRTQLVMGRAVYERDADLGRILRIHLPPSAACDFVLIEDSWDGDILPGRAGCDFLIRLDGPRS